MKNKFIYKAATLVHPQTKQNKQKWGIPFQPKRQCVIQKYV